MYDAYLLMPDTVTLIFIRNWNLERNLAHKSLCEQMKAAEAIAWHCFTGVFTTTQIPRLGWVKEAIKKSTTVTHWPQFCEFLFVCNRVDYFVRGGLQQIKEAWPKGVMWQLHLKMKQVCISYNGCCCVNNWSKFLIRKEPDQLRDWPHKGSWIFVKFRYSERATKFGPTSTYNLILLSTVPLTPPNLYGGWERVSWGCLGG